MHGDTVPAGAWYAVVSEVWPDGDTFTASLSQDGEPDLWAEFSMRECGVDVTAGDLLILTPDGMTKRDLGVWTKEEIDEIRASAKAQYERLMRNME